MYKMEQIISNKNKIINKIKKYQHKINTLEDELYDIELELSSFDNKELLKNIKLNDIQNDIINCNNKNILVVAVPGSGKTHTLINRYIDLVVNKNVNPESLILITFTKKSGQEMLDRLNKYVPNKLPFYVGSLHGLGYKLLNKNDYSILDEQDTFEMITEIAEKITNNNFIVKNILYIYDKFTISHNCELITVLEKMDINPKFLKSINKIFCEYTKEKKRQKLLDFNDLMILLNKYLESNKGDEFLNTINYIFFDEFQDINPIQNSILEKFKPRSNIMVVGDDSQSIYSFRGSNVNFILNYESDRTFYLENNYRSTPYIIDFFSDIIKNNRIKMNKNILPTQDNMGIKPSVRYFQNQNNQYEWIAEQIKNNYNNGVKLEDMVILSRTNNSLKNMELYLKKENINYVKSSGISILNKPHIKDLMAIISLIYNNKNTISIKRILRLNKINFTNNVSNNVSIDLFKFNNELNEFYNNLLIVDDKEKIQKIRIYIDKFYPDHKSDIKSVINFLKNGNTLKENYNDLYLNLDIDNTENNLLLSTIHSSKGLEWNYVYIIDCSNEYLPNSRSCFYKDEISNFEEERRLFYVACSRAKNFLNLTYSGDISPFIKEIDNNKYINNNLSIKDDINIKNIYDIRKKIKMDGLDFCMDKLINSSFKESNINNKINIDIEVNLYIDHFLVLIIKKIIINNFKNIKNKMILKVSDNLLSNYFDPVIDINNSLKTIKLMTDKTIKYNYKNNNHIEKLLKYDFSYFEKEIIKFFGKNKNITINNDDSIIVDNYFYLIKNSTKNICNTFNILKLEYLSKGKVLNLYNPFLGKLFTITI